MSKIKLKEENNITTIVGSNKTKTAVENTMNLIFLTCGLAAVICVICISFYMIISGSPIFAKIGIVKFLFGKTWYPGNGKYGILPMLLSSIVATFIAILVALPVGVLIAIFLAKLSPGKLSGVLRMFIDLLAGIPSVVYGLLGLILIVPLIYNLQHRFGLPKGQCLLAAIIILIIMILPTIISVSETAIRSVPKQYEDASLALGATKLQGIFRVTVPAAKSGIVAGMVLGVGRALGEAMAVSMVAGNAPIMPDLLKPVRLLTPSIPLEWAYSTPGSIHRNALFGIGLVLFVFIMIVNIILNIAIKKGGGSGDR